MGEGRFTWRVAVPPNVVATAWVPTSDPDSVTESGRPVAAAPGVAVVGPEPGRLVVTLGSGVYEFAAELAEAAVGVAEAAV